MAKYLFIGPDGAGKTSTAERFARIVDLPYVKYSQSKNVSEVVSVTSNLARNVNFKSCVIDRIKTIDHIVYHTVVDKGGLSSDELAAMKKTQRELEASAELFFVIYMFGTVDELWRRLTIRGDETYITRNHLTKIMDTYGKVFKYMFGNETPDNVRFINIDTTHLNPDQVFEQLLEVVDRETGTNFSY